MANGLCGWKAIKRGDGSFVGEGIDGQQWDQPLITPDGESACPVALLPQPGTQDYLPVTTSGGRSRNYWIWDPTGSTVVEIVEDVDPDDDEADGQAFVLPLRFWHLLKLRDEAVIQETSSDYASAGRRIDAGR